MFHFFYFLDDHHPLFDYLNDPFLIYISFIKLNIYQQLNKRNNILLIIKEFSLINIDYTNQISSSSSHYRITLLALGHKPKHSFSNADCIKLPKNIGSFNSFDTETEV